jgi:hypothetical protein
MVAQPIALRRMARAVALVVCFGLPSHAEAQLSGPMPSSVKRSLARACRFGAWRDCFDAVTARWDRIADTLLAPLQAPSQVSTTPQKPAPKVVWDGTFPHPDAPTFDTLTGLVPADGRTSAEVCAQLPDQLKADRQLLLRMTCQAERELLAAGAGQWRDEHRKLQELRTLLAACLPPATPNSNPCATP